MFENNRERAVDYLNTWDNIYVFDGYAGWDPKYRIKARVVCAIFGEPDYNADQLPASRFTEGVSSTTSVEINFKRMNAIILGMEYAGEMKKGAFSVMARVGQLSLHPPANVGIENNDATLFCGLSDMGKTTLSAGPRRKLIGDDEHVWSDDGVFNFEGGCYAKCVDLSAEKETEISNAVRFGSILENVAYNPILRVPHYVDVSITESTRCAYPIEFIPNAQIPCVVNRQQSNIIMLTYHAFGALPPTCYFAPFIVLHPGGHAEMLAERMSKNDVDCWLINAGWTGDQYGTGKRCPLNYTRMVVHSGELAKAEYETFRVGTFGLQVLTHIEGVPRELSSLCLAWTDKAAFEREVRKLAVMFQKAFALYP
ncbi:uncharacterized protein B0H18DRAFT_960799 [Fomitopsis serialis]|uniref:uncharacterized protein n=1 Tax=Fomitopsis serialis TaxID=139415 RepID=UPI002007AC4C|nr:uncharacterized protein B0H18DRAFT_960799 [Neoantrodia serialis]KAH9912739.1 hypothetical protein B0H18DRAFT_960799 [Neoantrodia serialis]